MKVVYASRTGNVESIISKLGIEDALKIEDGSETVEEDYILFTYTDGFGDVPSFTLSSSFKVLCFSSCLPFSIPILSPSFLIL